MKKIFITGCAGFIGFHLARYLKDRGDFVIGCDNFNSYYDPILKRKRAELLDIPIMELDICNAVEIHKLLVKHEITHFVHLAAQAGVRHSFKNPESYVHSNLNGFVQVLEACKNVPQIKFIFASSSSVYGLNDKIPFSETDSTDRPANLYGATKKTNELTAFSYHHLYGLPVTGLRFFTAYGPWGRPDMAYFSFTRAILKGETIPLYHSGMMQRDFTYIDDIVKGTAAAIDLGAANEIFNLGNHQPIEVNTLITLLEQKLGKKAKTELLEMQKGEALVTFADISKSQQMLNFSPSTQLNKGLDKFLDWYLSYHA